MYCCANAVGQASSPAYIFPRVHFKPHMLHNAPNGSLKLACKSGWMTKELFVEVFNHFLKFTNASTKLNPDLLVMDNHKSLLSVALVNAARDNGVTIVTFPPHCSHRLQPLDVSVYGAFKSFYDSAYQSWMLFNSGCPLTIYDLASLSASACYHAFTPSSIAAGLKKTGIYPFDDKFSQMICFC